MSMKLAQIVSEQKITNKAEILKLARELSELNCLDVSRTKQSFTDECDINKIMDKYENQGVLFQNSEAPQWGDFTDVPTYQQSLQIAIDAQNHFETLPAKVRKQFDNEPANFLEFMSDEKNYDEALKLGLFVEKPKDDLPPQVAPKVAPDAV